MLWQIEIPPPWKAEEFEECVEFTQPEGVGALHISGSQKMDAPLLQSEVLTQLRENCPKNVEVRMVQCGNFTGYATEYINQNKGTYWKTWFIAYRQVLLYVTYNCKAGEEALETPQATALLSSLALAN